jgi:hypothetical protein
MGSSLRIQKAKMFNYLQVQLTVGEKHVWS